MQGPLALMAAAAVAALWRSRAEYELKAAALGVGVLLVTPYLYPYDLMVLAVPLAFLWRLGRMRGFLPYEMANIGLVCLLLVMFAIVKAPVGFGALLLTAALISRRALTRQPALA